MNYWKMERDLDRWFRVASAVMRALDWNIMVNRELSQKAIYAPTLTNGQEL